ncbi:MAG: bis(5'-nucleosyl)-tetraphosphatase [Candidatus Scatovivens sp.]
MKKEKSCGCIVINNNKVLLVKHRKGHWDFPKGHVEGNETEEETAIREVKEETNIDVEIQASKKYKINYIIEDKQVDKDVFFFLAQPLNLTTKPQYEEVDIAEWKTFEEALNLITYENSKNIFKQVLKDLKIE